MTNKPQNLVIEVKINDKILRFLNLILAKYEIFGVLCLRLLNTILKDAQMFLQTTECGIHISFSDSFGNQSVVIVDALISIQHQS